MVWIPTTDSTIDPTIIARIDFDSINLECEL